jgi:hypothetical protein
MINKIAENIGKPIKLYRLVDSSYTIAKGLMSISPNMFFGKADLNIEKGDIRNEIILHCSAGVFLIEEYEMKECTGISTYKFTMKDNAFCFKFTVKPSGIDDLVINPDKKYDAEFIKNKVEELYNLIMKYSHLVETEQEKEKKHEAFTEVQRRILECV